MYRNLWRKKDGKQLWSAKDVGGDESKEYLVSNLFSGYLSAGKMIDWASENYFGKSSTNEQFKMCFISWTNWSKYIYIYNKQVLHYLHEFVLGCSMNNTVVETQKIFWGKFSAFQELIHIEVPTTTTTAAGWSYIHVALLLAGWSWADNKAKGYPILLPPTNNVIQIIMFGNSSSNQKYCSHASSCSLL